MSLDKILLHELRVFKASIKEKKIVDGRYLILFEFCDDSVKVVKPLLPGGIPRGVERAQYDSVKEGDIVGIEMYCRSKADKERLSTWEFSMEDLAKEETESEEECFGVKMGEYKGRWTIGPLGKKPENY
jgi:hypothetical protein